MWLVHIPRKIVTDTTSSELAFSTLIVDTNETFYIGGDRRMEELRTIVGNFNSIELDFTPEPPLTEKERSRRSANYPTALAYLHIYLSGDDAATAVPSGYMIWILDGLLGGISDILSSQSLTATANWFSDPWCFELRGDLSRNLVYITLHVPGRWVAMRDVCLPLDLFAREVIRLSKRWSKYLNKNYYEEITHPEWSEQYRRFESYLRGAEKLLQGYCPS